jgi:hypothetical protein
MYGINKVNTEDMQVGNYAYSDFSGQWYVVSILPNFVMEGYFVYALIRLDGHGYYYKSESLDELRKKISQDGGETTIYKDLVVEVF